MIEEIYNNQQLLSLIIRADFKKNGIEFFTNYENTLQLGYMLKHKGDEIIPHIHNNIQREITDTQEVLIIKNGKVRIDYFSNDKVYLESKIVEKGDVILLITGGHGFKILETSEIIEVKQGPFNSAEDKYRFHSLDDSKMNIIFK